MISLLKKKNNDYQKLESYLEYLRALATIDLEHTTLYHQLYYYLPSLKLLLLHQPFREPLKTKY